MPAKTKEQPSKEWLWEKYWKMGKSTSQIGADWAAAIGREVPFGSRCICTWMRKHDISLRPKHCGVVRYSKTSKARALTAERLAEYRGKNPPSSESNKRGRAKSACVRTKRAWETRICCLPGCKEPVRKYKIKFRETWFCCPSHIMKYHRARQKERKHDAMLERMQQEADALLLKAQQEARDKLARGY